MTDTTSAVPAERSPRRGDRFEHARLIVGSPKAGTARPAICTVTAVRGVSVYYRSESGMKWVTDRDRFAEKVGRYVPTEDERAGGAQ